MAVPGRRLRRFAYDARNVPMLGSAVEHAYNWYFNRARGHVRLFRGVYANFAAALAAIPPGQLTSFDNAPSAERVLAEWLAVYPSDYPVMFWLAKLLRDHRFVFDWGGNVGLKYFAYRRYIDYPPGHHWVVADVPAVVELGKKTALREGADAIRFTTGLEDLVRADVLIAAGVLQFIEDPFATLRAASRIPRHILFNKVPVGDMPKAVTLHNMGTAFCPYHLFNRRELVSALDALDYRLVDEWKSPDVSCEVPFFAEYSIGAYSGFYFEKRER
ncbi:MAG: methyltransferase, TIGR04325 family [Candidatus Baltobacteraceae bacterium]